MAPAVLKSPARRAVLRGVAMAGLAGGLTGCGFALRQAPTFAFDSVQVTGSENTSMSRALQQAMLASGIQVTNSSAASQAGTPVTPQVVLVVLAVLVDQHERVVSGQNESGEVRELTLRARFRFRLSTPAGKYLLEETELLLERDISFSETAALSKAAEENMMFRDMDGDIVQQVVRRLAAVKSL
ncbi:LPS assembly lipoprotein LptE [Hydrogenophaga sp.]|uniref:LPS-assembly lipoprotein LptE n=1 Tax=Hydrogenophaga sp. TaxID=1904254 RepID=UPI0035B42DDA